MFAALAVSRWIEHKTGWSIRRFVKTARRYRTIEIQAGDHVITAADPLPTELRQAIEAINGARREGALAFRGGGGSAGARTVRSPSESGTVVSWACEHVTRGS